MKIPKNVAKVMYHLGFIGAYATMAIPIYTTFKGESLQHSAPYVKLEEIKKTSSDLTQKLLDCAPASNSLPQQECIDLKVQYNALQEEQKAILASESYKTVEKNIQDLSQAPYYALGNLAISAIIGLSGIFALKRREYEEYQGQAKSRICNQQI